MQICRNETAYRCTVGVKVGKVQDIPRCKMLTQQLLDFLMKVSGKVPRNNRSQPCSRLIRTLKRKNCLLTGDDECAEHGEQVWPVHGP